MDGAIEAFRQVTLEEPESIDGWENQGVALLRKGIQTSERDHFRESAMCLEMAYEVSNDPHPDLIDNINALKETILQIFPSACQKEDSLYDTCLLLKDLLGKYKAKRRAQRESAKRKKQALMNGNEFQLSSEE